MSRSPYVYIYIHYGTRVYCLQVTHNFIIVGARMAFIHLLGGKKKLLTIQVTDLVHLQSLVQWTRLLKKHARTTIAVLTSLGLLLFLATQYPDILNRDEPSVAPTQPPGQRQVLMLYVARWSARPLSLMHMYLASLAADAPRPTYTTVVIMCVWI